MRSLLLLRTVVLAVCNMSERVLPTLQGLNAVAKSRVEWKGELTVRALEARTPKPKIRIREKE